MDKFLEITVFCDSEQLNRTHKIYKFRPVINELDERFLKFSFNGEKKSINESMIPFYGTCGSRKQNGMYSLAPCRSIWLYSSVWTKSSCKERKLAPSTAKWGLGKMLFCDWWNAYPQLLVIIYLWTAILHFFFCLPTLGFATFQQQMSSSKIG